MMGRAQIESLIPHAGLMCFLDTIVFWDEFTIRCTTRTHLNFDNPLRRNGQLAAVHLCEYGAQAMAVHGGLLAQRNHGAKAASGMLSSLRGVELAVGRIDTIEDPLDVVAHRKIAGNEGWLYEFNVSADGCWLAHGRISVSPVRSLPPDIRSDQK